MAFSVQLFEIVIFDFSSARAGQLFENSNLEQIVYKAGWLKHPSTQWVMASSYNYMWLYRHMMALNNEYKKRYNHKSRILIIQLE